MAYDTFEDSVESGQPIELFKFSNLEERFCYTNGPDEVVFDYNTYIPIPIKRTDPDLENVQARRNLVVKVPLDNPFALRYVVTVPASIDEFALYRQHSTDTPTLETIQFFSGRVTNVSFMENEAQINVLNFGSILERLVPQQTCRNPCNHVLYDSKCLVTDTSYALTGTVTAISSDGLTVTLDTGTDTVPATGNQLSAQLTADSAYFTGGFLRRGGIEHRMVRAANDLGSNEVEFTVLLPLQTIAVGTVLDLFAGCDHQYPTCKTKFSNGVRYGGFPFVPLKNVFEIGVTPHAATAQGVPGGTHISNREL
jgi:hypothetical protein